MKCQFCGKEIAKGSKFCDGCGAKQEEVSAPVSNPNVGYYQPPKKNTGLIVTIIILIVVIIALVVVGLILLLNKGDSSSDSGSGNDIADKGGKDDGGNSGGGNTKSTGHTLHCEMSSYEGDEIMEIEYNSSNTKPVKITMEAVMDSDGFDAKDVESLYCSYLSDYDTCKAKNEGSKIRITATASDADTIEDMIYSDDIDLDSVKDAAEDDGYKCKIK